MDNLNNALKRIKKKKEVKEAAPLAIIGKGLAMAGKAVAKGAAAAAKGGAKAAKSGAKAAQSGAKAVAKASKPVARNLTKRRNVKNPKYRKPDGSFNKKLYDQDGNPKTQGYMSDIEKPTDSRADTASGSQRQTAKIQDAEKRDTEARDKKVQDTAQDLKKKTGDTVKSVGDAANTARKKAKGAVSATTSAFGTSSFKKEDYNYVEEYLKNL